MRYQRSAFLASACAYALGMAAVAQAQNAPSAPKEETKQVMTSLEEVIVTGSLIQGTPEDTALPVEVITEQDLRDLGRPSNIDLIKTLSEVGQVAGEANRYNSYPIGAATVNLRNLGARFTTVVFNGRRFPEQFSVATGRFNNINWIPNSAIGRVEILKEGGAATYGADAVGGVVNYITRRNQEGFEINADYRYINDSDGDYTADVLWGKKFDNGNLMLVGGYQHRSILNAFDRDFARVGPLENRTAANWSANGSPGSYAFMTTAGQGSLGTISPTGVAGNLYTGNRHMSSTGLVRDPNCNALGGFSSWSATPSPVCYLQIAQFENLVEETDTYQFYGELNLSLGESTNLHVEALYYQQDLPNITNYPSDSPASWPIISGSATGARQFVGVSPTYFVSGLNPSVGHFLNNFYNADGVTAAYTPAQITAMTTGAGGRVALVQAAWRPFGVGGNPAFGNTDTQHNNNELMRLTVAFDGDLPEFWDSNFRWDVGATYSRVNYSVETQDMLVDRLQGALNGFGGANCNGIRAGLAGSTCQWFYPFSSSIERNVFTGAYNPGYVPAFANDPAMVASLYVPISLERVYNNYVFDAKISGKTGIELPGGPIAAALGVQYRYSDEAFSVDDLSNRQLNPCATPGVALCANQTGPLVFTRNVTVLGTTRNSTRFYPVGAVFGEMQFPILDSLNFQLAGRYEKFISDITETDNSIFVPAAALKWQPLDEVAFRISAGRTFSQVNPPRDDGPVVATAAANNTFGGIVGYETRNYDNVAVEPEKGTYFSTGFLFAVDGFTGKLDYFDIRVDDYTRTMTANQILRALTGPGVVTGSTLVRCNTGLIDPQAAFGGQGYVFLPGGCTEGVTTISAVGPGAVINYFGGTGESNSGELKTTGIDLSASYVFDNVAGGTFTPSIDATYNLEYSLGDFVIGGITVAEGYDGLGFKNGSTGRLGISVPEWRGSVSLNYRHGRHSLNLLATFIPSVVNEDVTEFDATNDQNSNIGDANGVTTSGTPTSCTVLGQTTSNLGDVPANAGTGQFGAGSIGTSSTGAALTGTTRGFCGANNVANLAGQEVEGSTNLDLTYQVDVTDKVSFSLSIYNVLDEEPSFDRATVGYNAGFGSPLERNFKVGVRMKL